MRLETVTLSGFRCFGPKPITAPVSGEITCVVGPNASGKTTFLHGLSKLFGVSRAQRTIQRSDFHLGPKDDPEDRSSKDLYIEVLIGLPELADGSCDVGNCRTVVPAHADCARRQVTGLPTPPGGALGR